MKVHRTLGPGFLEAVYVNALAFELTKRRIGFDRNVRLQVYYEGEIMGDYEADFVVESCVVTECKANRTLVEKNEVQLVNCLSVTIQDLGLLINFGSDRLQFKRKTRTYRPNPAKSQ